MNKVLSLLFVFVSLVTLAACGGKTTSNETTNATTSATTNNSGTTTEPEETYDLGGIDFIIMCDTATTCDPRSQEFKRLFKNEKSAKIAEVEEKYNINIVYQSFPSQASWGGARQRWIIEQTSIGNSPAHVYEMNSSEIANLAIQNAILPLDDLIEKYGSEYYWPEAMPFGEVNGKHYTYHDNYPSADYGIYYNADLLEYYLGESRRNEPSELWLDGEWDWDAFRSIADELNSKLDENRTPDNGGPQYVMGGRTYNWAYQTISANGGHLITPGFDVQVTGEETINALNFLNSLRTTPGMWLDNAPLSNASQPEFKDGNIAFHNGQSYWLLQSNKWLDRDFDMGFVPYPTGDNTKEDLSNYYIANFGIVGYVISAAFSKDLIPEGYEDLMLHDETIFKIWSDLQYFPEVDTETGYSSVTAYADEFYNTRLLPYYGDEISREAHLDIFSKTYPDIYTTFAQSGLQNEEGWMIKIQDSIQNGDVRNKMLTLESLMKNAIIEQYSLEEDFFE
ncbi:MAG: Maltose-binding periplasmic protein/domain [Haloplasmataceae bacterium]|jgi:ABC-type glycerol-3-phosphate transport system substrate-binding protein|nr:Maltose-binding periplasmic protein/domain [Haloplasmataceae bacterium]